MSIQSRRTKTNIPEYEKDERYWERRKKNNIAAKKSRENKRHFEETMRIKNFALEKVNTLLKKELSIIKSRFGIPEHHCMLSVEDQEEMKRTIEHIQNEPANDIQEHDQMRSAYRPRVKSEAMDEFLASPTHLLKLSSNIINRIESSPYEQELQHNSQIHNSITGHHSDIEQNMSYNNSNYRYLFSTSPSGSADSGYDCEPTDLSMKRKRPYEDSTNITVDITGDDKDTMDSDDDNALCIHEISDNEQEAVIKEIAVEAKRRKGCDNGETGLDRLLCYEISKTLPKEGEDLRSKLEALSEQVQSMYKLVYKN